MRGIGRGDRSGSRGLPAKLWLAWAFFIVYGTTIPFEFDADRDHVAAKLSLITLDPLWSPAANRRVSVFDEVQNVLLFVPFGVFGLTAFRQRRYSTPFTVVSVVALGATLSTAVEGLQLFTADRVSSFADICTNTLGAAVGAVATIVLTNFLAQSMAWMKALRLTRTRAFYPALVAGTLVCVALLEPFDVTIDVGTTWVKIKALYSDVWQIGEIRDELLQILRFGLFALFTASWLRQLGVRRPALTAALAGAAAGVLLEGSQLFISSRTPGVEDAVVNIIGAVAGAALFKAMPEEPRPATWFILLTIVSWLGAIGQMLSPFKLSPVYHGFNWFPFFSYYAYTSLQTVSHTLELALVYFPIGFAIPWTLPKAARKDLLAIVLIGVLQSAIEYMQGWTIDRSPDVTDVFVAVLGGLFGVWAGQHNWSALEATSHS